MTIEDIAHAAIETLHATITTGHGNMTHHDTTAVAQRRADQTTKATAKRIADLVERAMIDKFDAALAIIATPLSEAARSSASRSFYLAMLRQARADDVLILHRDERKTSLAAMVRKQIERGADPDVLLRGLLLCVQVADPQPHVALNRAALVHARTVTDDMADALAAMLRERGWTVAPRSR